MVCDFASAKVLVNSRQLFGALVLINSNNMGFDLRFARHQLALILTILLSACAIQPSSPLPAPPAPINASINLQHLATLAKIKSFTLKGRIGVVTQKQGFSGSIEWQHQLYQDIQTRLDYIDVYSPVGGKIANIAKTANGVTLTDQKGHSISAQDAESLTEMTLGFRLPLTGLSDWALGKPTANKIDASSWDEKGRLLSLKQDGWYIIYDNYANSNGVDLPNKIVLKSEKVNLKLIIDKCTINQS